MALIELVDELYKEVSDMIKKDEKLYTSFVEPLKDFTSNEFYNENINRMIFDTYKELIKQNNVSVDDVCTFLNDPMNLFIKEKVNERNSSFIKLQPMSIVLYYLIKNNKNLVLDKWPNLEREIMPFYKDLGFSNESMF